MTNVERGGCPSWCRTPSAEHDLEQPDELDGRLHEGPAFGLVRTWLLEGEEQVFSATVEETDGGLGDLAPDDLRQLAADALDAAMWMDRQARALPQEAGMSVVELVRRAHDQATRSA